MKILTVALVLVLSLLSVPQALAGRPSENNHLIRLHVHAHSNSEEDQRLKFLVRDVLLREVRSLDFENVESVTVAQAKVQIERALPRLKQVIAATLEVENAPYGGALAFGVFLFPSRTYGRTSLPAGRYLALNVHLGTGQGENWWCVMYPPLCLVDGVVVRGGERRFEFALANFLRKLWRSLRR